MKPSHDHPVPHDSFFLSGKGDGPSSNCSSRLSCLNTPVGSKPLSVRYLSRRTQASQGLSGTDGGVTAGSDEDSAGLDCSGLTSDARPRRRTTEYRQGKDKRSEPGLLLPIPSGSQTESGDG